MKIPQKTLGGLLLCSLILLCSPVVAATQQSAAIPETSASAAVTSTPSPSNPSIPIPTESRRLALDAAGAFVNDGFRIRDGEWGGMLTKGAPAFLSVTFFEGVKYWFVGASSSSGALLRLTIYDAEGKPLKGEQWKDSARGAGTRCAVGVAPEKSGRYFVGVELMENPNGSPVDFSVVYAYK